MLWNRKYDIIYSTKKRFIDWPSADELASCSTWTLRARSAASFLSLQHLWWSVLRICLIARSCEDHLKSFSQTVHLKKPNLFSTFCKIVSFAFQIWYDPSRNLVMTRLDKQNSGGFRSTISCFNAVALFAVHNSQFYWSLRHTTAQLWSNERDVLQPWGDQVFVISSVMDLYCCRCANL